MSLKYMTSKSGDELTSARELCDRFQTPFDTMAKVLQMMNQHGLLTSVKGINGGYVLAKPLSTVSFHDLSFIIDGTKNENFCHSSKGLCELHAQCNISDPLENLNQKIQNYLKTVSLQDLLVGNHVNGLSDVAEATQ